MSSLYDINVLYIYIYIEYGHETIHSIFSKQ